MNSDLDVQNSNPLVDPPPQSVQLKGAPLPIVLTQLRFFPVANMESQGYIAGFQEAVRKDYPRFSSEKLEVSFQIPFGSSSSIPTARTFWRMASFDSKWILTLTQDFLTLETTDYKHRDDFVARWGAIVAAFNSSFSNITVTRLGLRYVNRVDDPTLIARLPEIVKPQALGVAALLPGPDVSMSEALYAVPEGKMRVRWGILPANAIHDPSIQPSPNPSWILDYDIFQEPTELPLDLSTIQEVTARFSERGYAMFRWMVKDSFLKSFGGAQ